MKRYGISNKEAEDFPYVAVLRDRDDGDAVLFADLQARDLKLAELVKSIDQRPWIDCACTTCVKNGEAYRELLAALETTNG